MAVKTTKIQCNQDVDLRGKVGIKGKVTCKGDAEINGNLIVNSAANIKDKSLTSADAGKVLTVNEDGSLSWQQKGAGGGMKAFFDAGGKCQGSTATSFDNAISFGDTSDLTDMSSMFYNCSSLTSVPSFDTSNVTNMNDMLYNCSSLETIHMINIGANLDIHYSTRFPRGALLEIIGNLKTVTTTKRLTMGTTNLNKLTEEDKAIATNKGWTLA